MGAAQGAKNRLATLLLESHPDGVARQQYYDVFKSAEIQRRAYGFDEAQSWGAGQHPEYGLMPAFLDGRCVSDGTTFHDPRYLTMTEWSELYERVNGGSRIGGVQVAVVGAGSMPVSKPAQPVSTQPAQPASSGVVVPLPVNRKKPASEPATKPVTKPANNEVAALMADLERRERELAQAQQKLEADKAKLEVDKAKLKEDRKSVADRERNFEKEVKKEVDKVVTELKDFVDAEKKKMHAENREWVERLLASRVEEEFGATRMVIKQAKRIVVAFDHYRIPESAMKACKMVLHPNGNTSEERRNEAWSVWERYIEPLCKLKLEIETVVKPMLKR